MYKSVHVYITLYPDLETGQTDLPIPRWQTIRTPTSRGHTIIRLYLINRKCKCGLFVLCWGISRNGAMSPSVNTY